MDKSGLTLMVEKDIEKSTEIFANFSYDGEKMLSLFNEIHFRYKDIIAGFSKDLSPIAGPEIDSETGLILRQNVKLLIDRLKAFYENGCDNDRLMGSFIKPMEKSVSMRFNELRAQFGESSEYTMLAKQDIINKLDEIEEILMSFEPREKKWNRLRPYLVWVSGKGADVALKFLPLFLYID